LVIGAVFEDDTDPAAFDDIGTGDE